MDLGYDKREDERAREDVVLDWEEERYGDVTDLSWEGFGTIPVGISPLPNAEKERKERD
jgi:hypothetical protein